MSRPFVIVAETTAVVPDLQDRFLEIQIGRRRNLPPLLPLVPRPKNRMKRVVRENVLDVGHEQFLVLLFVVKADCEDGLQFIEQFVVRAFQQLLNVRVDRLPEAIRFGDRRTRDQPAEVAPVHVARGIVVGVKKIGVLRNHRAVGRHPNLQNEGLKEPAGVREVPFRRTNVRHRLHDVIFGLECLA